MSDTPQGPDWWQASDDKWYPPPRPEMPGDADATAVSPSGPVPAAGLVGLIVILSGGDDDPETEPTASTNTTAAPPTTEPGPDGPDPTTDTTEGSDDPEPTGDN